MNGQFILDTDARNSRMGAVLLQVQDGQEKLIEYYNKVLSESERNYYVQVKSFWLSSNRLNNFTKVFNVDHL